MGIDSDDVSARLWDRNRQAAMAEIYDTAMRLFVTQGFERTTIAQIAQEVGISSRSLFRYFGTKEDIVCGDVAAVGRDLAAVFDAQPAGSSAWQALREAFVTVFGDGSPEALVAYRLMHRTPAVRARHLEKRLQWYEALTPRVAARLAGGSDPGASASGASTSGAAALVGAAIACADAAQEAWLAREGKADIVALFDDAIAAVRS